jgi:hypothetical protein
VQIDGERLASLRQRYEVLGALPEFLGEREWVDRLRTFEDFVGFGPLVIESFAGICAEEAERRRQMAPELYELLREAFAGGDQAEFR